MENFAIGKQSVMRQKENKKLALYDYKYDCVLTVERK